MKINGRQSGLSISETDEFHRFSHTEWCEELKTCSEQHFCREKCIGNERAQRRMARPVWAEDANSSLNNYSLHPWWAEEASLNACRALRKMGYINRSPHQVPFPPFPQTRIWVYIPKVLLKLISGRVGEIRSGTDLVILRTLVILSKDISLNLLKVLVTYVRGRGHPGRQNCINPSL